MKIAKLLTPEQKARMLARNYRFDQGYLVTADLMQVCPLAAALGLIYTPADYHIAQMLGGTRDAHDAVIEFVHAADGGQILGRDDLAAVIGVSVASV